MVIPFRAGMVAALLLMSATVRAEAPSAPDFIIDGANRAGAITPFSTERQLIDDYGYAFVARGQVSFGGEGARSGTILFPGTEREAFIRWRGDYESPELIKVAEPSTPWITMEGATIGTSLEDLEALNGRPFVIASYDLDKGARTLSWENGVFAPELSFDLGPLERLSSAQKEVIGRKMTHLSSDPVIRKLRFSVRAININW